MKAFEGFEESLQAEGFSERFCLFGKIPIFAFLSASIFKLTLFWAMGRRGQRSCKRPFCGRGKALLKVLGPFKGSGVQIATVLAWCNCSIDGGSTTTPGGPRGLGQEASIEVN